MLRESRCPVCDEIIREDEVIEHAILHKEYWTQSLLQELKLRPYCFRRSGEKLNREGEDKC